MEDCELPEAVGLRRLDEPLERAESIEPVLPHELDGELVVFDSRRIEAEWPVYVVGMPVVGARDERDAFLAARGGDRLAGPDVLWEGTLARWADDDGRSCVAAEEPERNQGAPVQRMFGERRVVAAEAQRGAAARSVGQC